MAQFFFVKSYFYIHVILEAFLTDVCVLLFLPLLQQCNYIIMFEPQGTSIFKKTLHLEAPNPATARPGSLRIWVYEA